MSGGHGMSRGEGDARGATVRIAYDPEADALVVVLGEGACRSSRWVTEDVAVDLSVGGRPLSIEVLDAGRTADMAGMGRFSVAMTGDDRWPWPRVLHDGR